MCRSHVAACGLAAALFLGIAGCATTGSHSLGSRLDGQVRELTMRCYWQHEGERWAIGGFAVYEGCRSWAREQVRVRIPAMAAASRQ